MTQTTKDLAQNLQADAQKVEETVKADVKKVKSELVEFVTDIFPYCKGDVVKLTEDEVKRVLAEAKARKVTAFKAVKR